MSYKTILVHIDESKHVDSRIKVAGRIALDQHAHLVGVAMTGIESFLQQAVAVNLVDPVMAPFVETLRARSKASLDKFDEVVQGLGVESVERRLIDDAAAPGFCMQAGYADLVVVGQNDASEKLLAVGPDFPEYVAINSHCPTLIVPYIGEPKTIGNKILIAWNGSIAAKRAVLGALPLLKRASTVDLVVFRSSSPQMYVSEERLHGSDMALFLTRHGVNVNVKEQVASHNSVGNDLLSLAAHRESDLLVMGCYGHSRLSEKVFGGVSRLVLESMTIPVLMSY